MVKVITNDAGRSEQTSCKHEPRGQRLIRPSPPIRRVWCRSPVSTSCANRRRAAVCVKTAVRSPVAVPPLRATRCLWGLGKTTTRASETPPGVPIPLGGSPSLPRETVKAGQLYRHLENDVNLIIHRVLMKRARPKVNATVRCRALLTLGKLRRYTSRSSRGRIAALQILQSLRAAYAGHFNQSRSMFEPAGK